MKMKAFCEYTLFWIPVYNLLLKKVLWKTATRLSLSFSGVTVLLVILSRWNVFSPVHWLCFFLLVHCWEEAVSFPLCFAGLKSKHMSAGNACRTSVSLGQCVCFFSFNSLSANNHPGQRSPNRISQSLNYHKFGIHASHIITHLSN